MSKEVIWLPALLATFEMLKTQLQTQLPTTRVERTFSISGGNNEMYEKIIAFLTEQEWDNADVKVSDTDMFGKLQFIPFTGENEVSIRIEPIRQSMNKVQIEVHFINYESIDDEEDITFLPYSVRYAA